MAFTIAVLIALIIIIITSSGNLAENNTKISPGNQTVKIPTKIYSAGGIYLEYPATWNITTDQVNGNNMQIVIQDPASANKHQQSPSSCIYSTQGPKRSL